MTGCWKVARCAPVLAFVVAVVCTPQVQAADRVVLVEQFTATW